jgi:hypothetical protein
MLQKKVSHTLKYSEMYEIFKNSLDMHHWESVLGWITGPDGTQCEDAKDPMELFTHNVFWAYFGAQYFPFRSYELAKDA